MSDALDRAYWRANYQQNADKIKAEKRKRYATHRESILEKLAQARREAGIPERGPRGKYQKVSE